MAGSPRTALPYFLFPVVFTTLDSSKKCNFDALKFEISLRKASTASVAVGVVDSRGTTVILFSLHVVYVTLCLFVRRWGYLLGERRHQEVISV